MDRSGCWRPCADDRHGRARLAGGAVPGAAGVGTMTMVDEDVVDLTNLQRQILHARPHRHAQGRCGRRSWAPSIRRCASIAHRVRADAANLGALVAGADVVLDCCDNFATRHAVNAACVRQRKPLVSGAAVRFDGQVAVFDARDAPAGPAITASFRRRRRNRGDALRDHGRVRAAGRHHRQHAGGRGVEAASGRGSRSPDGCSCSMHCRMEWSEIRIGRQPSCSVCGRA